MARSFEDKYDLILRHWRDRTGTQLLDAELEKQLERWQQVRTWLLASPHEEDRFYLDRIKEEFECGERTAWQCLKDSRRFFADVETVNVQYEKVLQIADLKQRIKAFKVAGDGKSEMAARKLLADLTGTTRPDAEAGGGGGTTIINILNYDPSLIGAVQLDNLDEMISQLLLQDEEKAKHL